VRRAARPPGKLPVLYWFPAPYGTGPNRQYQLTASLSRLRRVLYLAEAPAPMNSPTRVVIADGLEQVTVLTLERSRQNARLRRRLPFAAGLQAGRAVARALAALGVDEHVLVLGGPTRSLLVPTTATRRALDLQDPPFGDERSHRRDLRRIAAHAELVITTAAALDDLVIEAGATPQRIPNAVRASSVQRGDRARTRDPERGDRPVVGYLGTVDTRFDIALVRDLARLLPQVHFVIAGRINWDRRAEADAAEADNLSFVGPLGDDEGEEFLHSIDVGLVPFRPGRRSDAINATKYYHYAAFGLPIVSTDSREARALAPIVTTGQSAQELARAITDVLRTPGVGERQREFARRNTWEVRARRLDELLERFCDHGPPNRWLGRVGRWLL